MKETPSELLFSNYEVQRGDTLSTILFGMGIGTPSSPHRIYGKNGWMAKLREINPGTDLANIRAGQTILVPNLTLNANVAAKTECSPADVKSESPGATEKTVRRESYVIRGGDTLSTLLFERGVGHPGGDAFLFGPDGWIKKTESSNPEITQWNELKVGQTIVLVYPTTAPTPTNSVACADPVTPPPAVSPEDIREIVSNPKAASLEAITSLPPEAQREIPPAIIAAKLDKATIATLDEEAVAKIPPAAIEEKAAEVSFSDRNDPGMKTLFKDLKRTPSAYFGARVGFSLANPSEALVSKVKSYGLVAEIRSGALDGLRLLYESVPKVESGRDLAYRTLEYERLLLGWAFELEAPFLFDLVHLTPRLGRYNGESTPPRAIASPPSVLKISNAPSLGLEVDAEFARYFYVVRFWAARDLPVGAVKSDFQSTISRVGIDTYVKGGGFTLFGSIVSPSYLLYVAYEDLLIEDSGSGGTRDSLHLQIPMAGFGYTLTIK